MARGRTGPHSPKFHHIYWLHTFGWILSLCRWSPVAENPHIVTILWSAIQKFCCDYNACKLSSDLQNEANSTIRVDWLFARLFMVNDNVRSWSLIVMLVVDSSETWAPKSTHHHIWRVDDLSESGDNGTTSGMESSGFDSLARLGEGELSWGQGFGAHALVCPPLSNRALFSRQLHPGG